MYIYIHIRYNGITHLGDLITRVIESTVIIPPCCVSPIPSSCTPRDIAPCRWGARQSPAGLAAKTFTDGEKSWGMFELKEPEIRKQIH